MLFRSRDGKDEIAQALVIKNTIPNVSAVLFSKTGVASALKKLDPDLNRLKIAGDWMLYSEMLLQGNIAFVSKSLNNHRRHTRSVTINPRNNATHMAEILFMQERLAKSIGEISDSTRQQAEEFARHAAQHLGMNEHEYPSISEGVKIKLDQLRTEITC